MHRCYVNPKEWTGSDVRLSTEESHHVCHVLRAVVGDRVLVFDGQGREGEAEIVGVPNTEGGLARRRPAVIRSGEAGGGGGCLLKVLSERRVPRAIRPAITLIQALPKNQRMDWLVEKVTELGAAAVWPVITERVIVRLSDAQRTERSQRWQRLALAAARQCGTSWVPEIRPVSGLSPALAACGDMDLFLVGSLDPVAEALGPVLRAAHLKGAQRAALLIGPEGDLSPAEQAQALGAGAVRVRFGPLVLRVETAALYGISVMAYALTEP